MTNIFVRSLFLIATCCIGSVKGGFSAEIICGHTLLVNSVNTAWDMYRILEKLDVGDIEGARKSAESTQGADDSTLKIMTPDGQSTESKGVNDGCSARMIEDTRRHQEQMRSIIDSLARNDSQDAKKMAEESFDLAMQIVQKYPRREMTPQEMKIVDNFLRYAAQKRIR